jgi:exopolysaccharide biosynthesis polyprenyl glycosylphosphotransferase
LNHKREFILLLFFDIVAINVTWAIYYYIRIESGWMKFATSPSYLMPSIAITIYWIIIFLFSGLYQHWFARPRFDEFTSIFKSVSIGVIILFFVIFIDDLRTESHIYSRFIIILYWILLIFNVSLFRLIIRTSQKRLLRKGYGLQNTVILGTGNVAYEVLDMVEKYPENGYKFSGFVCFDDNDLEKENVLGKFDDLPEIINNNNISNIIIASEPEQKDIIINTINKTADMNVGLKIVPDLYGIVSGMARTQQLYGIPIIDVMPEIMSYSAKMTKRLIDISFSLIILITLSPLLLLTAILIKLTSKGPVFYVQQRVGRNGKIFNLYKFRSMIKDAEDNLPIWADKNDKRITPFGYFMRKTRLDEVPQFINVLKNDMSIVGPRPEREYFVEQLKKEIPFYSRRLRIKPGITGWAQVKHAYDSTVEDVRIKLKYDFYYIENMSLTLDFRIMLLTLVIIFTFKGY